MNLNLVSKINKPGVLLIMMCLLAFRWPGNEAKALDLEPSALGGVGQKTAAVGPVDGGGAMDDVVSEYHTPLAGEPFHTVLMGEKIDVPAEDRAYVTALTLGGTIYSPKQGD